MSASTTLANIDDQTVAEKKRISTGWEMVQAGYTEEDGISRFFVKYNNLPALTSSDVVVSASISLYLQQIFNDSKEVEVHKVLGSWQESTIQWSNMPACSDTIEDFAFVQNPGWYDWNVTDIVRGWYSGENTGMMFKMSNAVEAARQVEWRQFEACEFGYRDPSLTIVFRNNNGLESYWDYTSQDAGRAGTGYINNYTGNLVWVRHDMGFDGNRMPVSISHIYNANDSTAPNDDNNANDSSGNGFGLGCGWRTNYNQLVYRWSEDSSYYVWEDSDGTDHYFYYTSANTYKDEDGLELTLTVGSDGAQKYKITDKYGNASYFDTQGRLTKLENNQQTKSSINITYISGDSRLISTITDGAGRLYVFTYTNGLLTRLSYMGSGTTEITYVMYDYSGSNLDTVIDKDRSTSILEYYDKNLLKMVWGDDNYEVSYRYDTISDWQPSRVCRVLKYCGDDREVECGELYIEYANNQTTFTDHNGNVQIMQFNNWGNTLSVQDDEGRAQYGQYANNDATNQNDSSKAHQLRLSSKLQNTVGNRLSDSSFEEGTVWDAYPAATTLGENTTDAAYLGTHSMRLTATEWSCLMTDNFTIEAGATYTFSAYVKGVGGTSFLLISNRNDMSSAMTTATNGSTDWKRVEISYTNTTTEDIPARAHLYCTAGGSAYIDCVQVEKASTASRYNLVVNGDFSHGLSGWTNNTFTSTDVVVTTDNPAPATQLDEHVLRVTGDPASYRQMLQYINISGSAGDTYVLSGWAKGNSVPLASGFDSNPRSYDVIVAFNNYDGSATRAVASFNPDSNNWQYAATAAVADKAYHSMVILLTYNFNANTVYYDGIQLYKEEFGNSYTYDDKGNVISVVDLQKQETTYEYDNSNNLTQVIQNNKAKMTYTYDGYHNVKTATTQEGLVYTFTYDAYGNNTQVSISKDGVTMTSSAAYTADGNRLVSTTDASGKTTQYSYNADTNALEWVQYPEDTQATRTEYTYDNMYRLTSSAVTTDTGTALTAGYTYAGDLLTELETESTTYTFSYGDFDLRSGISIGSRTLATYTYTNDQNFDLARLDYGNGDSIQYEYDDQGRVTKETFEDGETVTYQYDNDGALAVVTDSESGRTTRYYYDFIDRVMKYEEYGGDFSNEVEYTFDDRNNLTVLEQWISGLYRYITYSYDDMNRTVGSGDGRSQMTLSYDDFSRLSEKLTRHSGEELITDTYTYRSTGSAGTSSQLASLQTAAAGYNVTYSYTYDDNGNILSLSDGTHTTTYVYDSQNQLLRENNQAGGFTYTWAYDNAGNILSRKEYAYTTGTLGTPTDTVTYTYGDADWGDLLTGYDGRTFTYDGIGNLTSDGNRTYTWKHGRQLASMTDGSTTWTYTYNADGLRTHRTDGNSTYTYSYIGDQLWQFTVDGYTLYVTYDGSGRPWALYISGTIYYYITNAQGDVTAILDDTGNPVTLYSYDAWGNLLSMSGSMADTLGTWNPLRYRGYVYDQETGLYYLQSRYYDPEIGRFISPDAFVSTGQGLLGYNMFLYCGNNPVMRIDVTGYAWVEFWDDAWDLIVDIYERNMAIQQQQQQLDIQIRLQQNNILKDSAKTIWGTYMQGVERQQQAQLQNSMALIEGVEYFIENPKQAENTLRPMVSVSVTAIAVIGEPITGAVVLAHAVGGLVLSLWDLCWQIADLVDDFQ